jgi:uncharacterized protein
MSVLLFTALLFGTSLLAGLLGALTGLGSGVVIVPVLVPLFKVDLPYPIGASLISVIATSFGAAAAYISEGLSNIRFGMFLEIATLGALHGTYLTSRISSHSIAVVFGIVLLYSAYASFCGRFRDALMTKENTLAITLKLYGTYSLLSKPERYGAQRAPPGFGIMFTSGYQQRYSTGAFVPYCNPSDTSCVLCRGFRAPERPSLHFHQFIHARDFDFIA